VHVVNLKIALVVTALVRPITVLPIAHVGIKTKHNSNRTGKGMNKHFIAGSNLLVFGQGRDGRRLIMFVDLSLLLMRQRASLGVPHEKWI
jgi:hypothetical protein